MDKDCVTLTFLKEVVLSDEGLTDGHHLELGKALANAFLEWEHVPDVIDFDIDQFSPLLRRAFR